MGNGVTEHSVVGVLCLKRETCSIAFMTQAKVCKLLSRVSIQKALQTLPSISSQDFVHIVV